MNLARRASFLLPLSLMGCSKTGSAESVAGAFIDRYYIERDHDRALALAIEGAADRVRNEAKLAREAGSAYGGVSPRIFYNLKGQAPQGEMTELTYSMTIDSSGFKLKKEVRLLVKKVGDEYRVAFFNERDLLAE
jgi:hypothetical protein